MNCRPDEALVVEDALHAIETTKKQGFLQVAVCDKQTRNRKKSENGYLSEVFQ